MVHEIENMKEQAVYDEIAKVIEQSEVAYFKLGGLLAVSLTNSWFNGYASFKEMIEGKFGFKYRKAMYLVEVYTKVVESGVAWAKLEPVGWTKVQIIAKVLTAENADKWIEIAKAQNAPTLANVVDLEIKKIAGLASGDETVKSVTNMHFKVHADQKATIDAALEKSKEISGTEVGAVALTNVCLDFLGGVTFAQRLAAIDPVAIGMALKQVFGENKEGLAAIVGAVGIEPILNAVSDAAPTLNITVDVIGDENGSSD